MRMVAVARYPLRSVAASKRADYRSRAHRDRQPGKQSLGPGAYQNACSTGGLDIGAEDQD